MRFLSPEWLDAAAGAIRDSPELRRATAETTLTLQQVVSDGPDGEVVYQVRIDRGSVELVPGCSGPRGPGSGGREADVIFAEDWDTAAAIAQGRLSPQAAFLDGRVRVSGNVGMVMRTQNVLARIGSALEGLRSDTTYGT